MAEKKEIRTIEYCPGHLEWKNRQEVEDCYSRSNNNCSFPRVRPIPCEPKIAFDAAVLEPEKSAEKLPLHLATRNSMSIYNFMQQCYARQPTK